MKQGFTYRFMSNTNVCRLSCWFWLDIWTHADQLAVISQKEINSLWKSYFTFQGLLNKLNCLVQFRQLRGGFFHPMSQQSQWVAPTLKQNVSRWKNLNHCFPKDKLPTEWKRGEMKSLCWKGVLQRDIKRVLSHICKGSWIELRQRREKYANKLITLCQWTVDFCKSLSLWQ